MIWAGRAVSLGDSPRAAGTAGNRGRALLIGHAASYVTRGRPLSLLPVRWLRLRSWQI